MIVLAPESIGSQNVKDELSYAIDAGKHILPVVIQPCKIPLRLRRFQYVNFTDKPYKDSLSEIKHLLSNTQQIAQAAVEKPFYEKEDAVLLAQIQRRQRGPFVPAPESGSIHRHPIHPRRSSHPIQESRLQRIRRRNNSYQEEFYISVTPTC